ncbi:MAG: methyltransferase [Eubacteriales bacterium]|nr:methyltransferase [Eubacteriales bacterium]MDD3197923.1 methyltransferase [Eubacteriales bacterium]MDD3503278.1 methyltransferase [Eubacteriales bacterium]MDD4682887.1 methyltransferase [Eubacteriales bacterium]
MDIIEVKINDLEMRLQTSHSLFSPRSVDAGTSAMLRTVRAELLPGRKLLDLGCGYGIVGLYAAHFCGAHNIWMLDVDPEAIRVSRLNALALGFTEINTVLSDGPESLIKMSQANSFDLILSNVPYHTDYNVAKRFIESSRVLLKDNGMLYVVVKKPKWYINKMKTILGGVRIIEDSGYYVLISEKRIKRAKNNQEKNIKQEMKTTKKHQKRLEAAKKNKKK